MDKFIRSNNFNLSTIEAIMKLFKNYKETVLDESGIDFGDGYKEYNVYIDESVPYELVRCVVYSDYQITVIPLKINNLDDIIDTIHAQIIKKTHGNTFAEEYIFDGNVSILTLPVPKDEKVFKCEETCLYGYESLMEWDEFYTSPYDESGDINYFINSEANNAYMGNTYSKDFSYFCCSGCYRNVCEQHPRNGFHIQYRMVFDEQVCLSCYEKDKLLNGVNESELKYDLPGIFIEEYLLFNENWVKYKPIFVNHFNQKEVRQEISDLLKDKKVFIQYDRLAIGGGEGSITVYIKDK